MQVYFPELTVVFLKDLKRFFVDIFTWVSPKSATLKKKNSLSTLLRNLKKEINPFFGNISANI